MLMLIAACLAYMDQGDRSDKLSRVVATFDAERLKGYQGIFRVLQKLAGVLRKLGHGQTLKVVEADEPTTRRRLQSTIKWLDPRS